MDFESLKTAGRGGFEKTRRHRRELWPYLASLGYQQGLQSGFDEYPITDVAARLCLLLRETEALDLFRCNLAQFPLRKDYIHACLTRISEVLSRKKDNFVSDSISTLALIVVDVLENVQVSYYTVSSMHDQPKFYLVSKEQRNFVMNETLHEMLRLFMPQTLRSLTTIHALEIKFTSLMFEDYFAEILPPSIFHLMMDAYLVEGVKILYRYAIALIWIYKAEIKANLFADSASFWLRVKRDAMSLSVQESDPCLLIDRLGLPHRLPESPTVINNKASVLMNKDNVIAIAFDSIRSTANKALRPMPISHSFIEQQHAFHTKRFKQQQDTSTAITPAVAATLHKSTISLESDFLSEAQIQKLGQALPKPIQTTLHWRLAYSANRDGWDMLSIYLQTKGCYPCILLFYLAGEGAEGVVLGAIHANELIPNKGQIKGDGRINSVFRFHNEELAMYPWVGISSQDPSKELGSDVTANQWAVCSQDSITFGGSATHNTNALRYDGEFSGRVSTGYSDTYGNPPLWISSRDKEQTSESNTYELRNLEIICASSKLSL